MRPRSGSIVRVAALLATVAIAGPAVATLAADDDPEVLSVASLDPHTIKDVSNPQALATLHVPPGRWAAWAVVRYSIDVAVYGANVDCWTKITSGDELDRHTVHAVTYGTAASFPVPYNNVAMSVVANVTSGRGAAVSVRCRGRWGVAREVRIVAMRAGTLTKDTPGGTTTWGSGSPVIRQSRLTQSVDVPAAASPETIASLDLGAGRWWVRAHLSLQGKGFSVDTPNFRRVECRLKLGGDSDESHSVVNDQDTEDGRAALTLEVAAKLNSPSSVLLRCARKEDDDLVQIRDIRITAVRANRLTLGSAAEEATPTTTGKGQPWIIHLHRSTPSQIPSSGDWITIGHEPLTPGRWFVTGKYAYYPEYDEERGRLECRLRLEDGTNLTRAFTKSTGDGIPLQLVGRIGRHGGDLWLECRQLEPSIPNDVVEYSRITAIRVR